jgi:hypothetical protein
MFEAQSGQRKLLRLVYTSKFVRVDKSTFGEVVRTIVAKSIQNNRVDNVTGFLIAGDDQFLQLLEGPPAAVTETFERIGRDPRHDALTVIARSDADKRLFQDWNMGQHHLAAMDAAILREVGLEGFTPGGLDEARALRLLTEVGNRYLR